MHIIKMSRPPVTFTINCEHYSSANENVLSVKVSMHVLKLDGVSYQLRDEELFKEFVSTYGRPQVRFSLNVTLSNGESFAFDVESNHFNYDDIIPLVFDKKQKLKNSIIELALSKDVDGTYVIFEKGLLDSNTDISPEYVEFDNFKPADTTSKSNCMLSFNDNKKLNLSKDKLSPSNLVTYKGNWVEPLVDTHIDTGFSLLVQHVCKGDIVKLSSRVLIFKDPCAVDLPKYIFTKSPTGMEETAVQLTVINDSEDKVILSLSPLNKGIVIPTAGKVSGKFVKADILLTAGCVRTCISVGSKLDR